MNLYVASRGHMLRDNDSLFESFILSGVLDPAIEYGFRDSVAMKLAVNNGNRMVSANKWHGGNDEFVISDSKLARRHDSPL
ncbi:hypothetical protein [Paraburkholderia pallida]|uniref:Uncharacterized protein n=1 Tax=Paraburkholderia pallida TaxID=2547399 RepID=A0A4P7D7A6_9BURK|nr:hypothetical protein [Paraburkholderia pallida]QBR04078.1 hypothetical protein E1956_43685 [Paraburkholderia pallida]